MVIAEGRHGGSAGNECACFDELVGRREFAMVLRLSGEARRARIRRRAWRGQYSSWSLVLCCGTKTLERQLCSPFPRSWDVVCSIP